MKLPNDWQKYALRVERIIDTNEGDLVVTKNLSPLPLSLMRYLVDTPIFENWHDHSKGWLVFIPEEAIEGEVIKESK